MIRKILKTSILFIGFGSIFAYAKTTELTFNNSEYGVVDKNQLEHYKIYVNAGDKIKVKLYDMDADGDLYVKVGSKAGNSTTKSDCHSWKSGKAEDTCELSIEKSTYVYIAVYAAKCIYNVEHRILVTKSVSNNSSVTTLTYNKSKRGIVDKKQIKHYKIQAKAGDKIKIKLYNMDADGDLYVKVGSKAGNSTTKSDCHSWKSAKADDTCNLSINKNTDVYIAVYAAKCINNVQHSLLVTKENSSSDYTKYDISPSDIESYSGKRFLAVYPKKVKERTAPVVFFIPGLNNKILEYNASMEFLASKGCMVIGAKTNRIQPDKIIADLEEGLAVARRYHNLTANKFTVIGHSIGGGIGFTVMKHFQHIDNPCGTERSMILSIEGIYPYGLQNKEDFNQINAKSFFLLMDNSVNRGGEDPRVILTTWALSGASDKNLLTLQGRDHSYIKNPIEKKEDLRLVLGALMNDVINGGNNGYNSIPNINKTSYTAIKNKAKAIDYYKSWRSCHYEDNVFDTLEFCHPEQYKW